jgi:ribosomal protein S8
MDTLTNGLITIINNEMRNKRECVISPASKLLGARAKDHAAEWLHRRI